MSQSATKEWTVVGMVIEGTLVIAAVMAGHDGSTVAMGARRVQGPMGITLWPTPWTSYTYGADVAEAIDSAQEAYTRWASEAGPIGDDAELSAMMRPRSVTLTHARPATVQAPAPTRRRWWPWGRR
jgi:hypothetical protein